MQGICRRTTYGQKRLLATQLAERRSPEARHAKHMRLSGCGGRGCAWRLEGFESERWFQGGIAFGAFFVCVLCAQLTLQTWHQTGSFCACGQIKAVFHGGFWLTTFTISGLVKGMTSLLNCKGACRKLPGVMTFPPVHSGFPKVF